VTINLADLAGELADLRHRFPKLKDDELFVLWFLTAYIVDDPEVASKGLVGGSRDKSVDAVIIDHEADRVAIVQGKYSTVNSSEGRPDVLTFAGLADVMADDARFSTWLQDSAPAARERMRAARQAMIQRGYPLRLCYVTTRPVSAALRSEAEKTARTGRSDLTVFQRSDVLALLRDYLDGVAPPIPLVELPIETTPASGVISRFDPPTNITSWIFSSKASDIAELYTQHGIKIFARNVRGYLGQGDGSSVNSAIRQTLARDPTHFWYFNNGVTIACDGAKQISAAGKQVLEMTNPQIVNGQQTTRTLAASTVPTQASVLVRVVALPKSQFHLIDEIVKATNRQNPIRTSDLMSNDRTQVFLERKLRLRGYQYLRKRAKKSEAQAVGNKARFVITKEELAQAVAACNLDPQVVRSAREALFDESNYGSVFPKQSVDYYLTRRWLVKFVGSHARGGGPERQYMKFFVAHALWDRLGAQISSRSADFIGAAERNRTEESPLGELSRVTEVTFQAVGRFFSRTRVENGIALEVYAFFKRRRKYDEYQAFMREREQAKLFVQIERADANFYNSL
jgi:hypothetical protein